MVPASLAPTPGRIGGPAFYPLREGSAGLELINSGPWLHCGEYLQRVLEFCFLVQSLAMVLGRLDCRSETGEGGIAFLLSCLPKSLLAKAELDK